MVLFICCLILHSLGTQMHADSCRYQGTWPHQCDHSPSDARFLLPPASRLMHRALEWVEKSSQTPLPVAHHPDPQQMDDPPIRVLPGCTRYLDPPRVRDLPPTNHRRCHDAALCTTPRCQPRSSPCVTGTPMGTMVDGQRGSLS